MIASLYIKNYLDQLERRYKTHGLAFNNYNETCRDLFFVPKTAEEHLVDYLAAYALNNQEKAQGEPFIYLGWNRGLLTTPDETEDINIKFDLEIFIVTNRGDVAENLEEAYLVTIQPVSKYPVYMAGYSEFQVNSEHSGMLSSLPILNYGLLWALKSTVGITGPAIALDERGKAEIKAISESLYKTEIPQIKKGEQGNGDS
jgi:hypothetical protein